MVKESKQKPEGKAARKGFPWPRMGDAWIYVHVEGMEKEQRSLRWEPERSEVGSGGRVDYSLKGNNRERGQEQKPKSWLGTKWGQLIFWWIKEVRKSMKQINAQAIWGERGSSPLTKHVKCLLNVRKIFTYWISLLRFGVKINLKW